MHNITSNNNLAQIFSKTSEMGHIKELFSEVEIQSINLYKKSKVLEILMISNKLIPAQTLVEIEEIFADYFNLNSVNINIKFNIPQPLESLLLITG